MRGNPNLADLSNRKIIAREFAQTHSVDPEIQQILSNFYTIWSDVFDHIKDIRANGAYGIGSKELRGKLFVEGVGASATIRLLIGFTERGEALTDLNAGMVLSCPVERVRRPDLFFDDYKLGLSQGVFVKMAEDHARMAMRYSMNVDILRPSVEKFPSILTPLKEDLVIKNLNEWVARCVTGVSDGPPDQLQHDI